MSAQFRRVAAVSLVVAATAASCGGSSGVTQRGVVPLRGGTLHLALLSLGVGAGGPAQASGTDYFLDPQWSYDPASWELLRCCLLRTLLSYDGRPTGGRGAELFPDLAESLPTVSRDGLTWTFQLRKGLHYAPPFEQTEITAPDIVRALERDLTPAPGQRRRADAVYLSPYRSYYEQVIVGAKRFADGGTDSISGLETPDAHTLVLHLLRPAGDLGYRLSLPGAAPIPPSPTGQRARLGVAEGHGDGYGRFLVASGPYMPAGSEKLNFSLPAAQQAPVAGYVPRRSLTLVRNPSWDSRTDPLRKAYLDRLEFRIGGTSEAAAAEVDTGKLDLVFDNNPPVAQVQQYLADPRRKGRVFVYPGSFFYYLPMNLAVPPFDDIHVRKAVSYVIDKAELTRLANSAPFTFGPAFGSVDTHLGPDSIEGDLLQAYDPYGTPGHRGSPAAARKEMAKSRYDRDGDGVCDSSACSDVRLVVYRDGALPAMAAIVRRDLARIGLRVRIDVVPAADFMANTPAVTRAALGMGWWIIDDYPSGASFFLLFSGQQLQHASSTTPPNLSLVGATPQQLARLGYGKRSVPSVDDRIRDCLPLVALAQVECWASLDQYMMEQVVPWVPYLNIGFAYTVSSRVTNFAYDEFTGLAALDQIAVKRSS